MKKVILFCYTVAALQGFSSCSSNQPKEDYSWLKNAIDTSVQQLEETVADVGDSVLLPRGIWTGYDMDFLCSQLQRDPSTFTPRMADPSTTGPAVSSPATCGMPTN